MTIRKSLTDILRAGDCESLSRAWGETKAAEDFAPMPAGAYVANVMSGEPFNSRLKGTPGYRLVFRVVEGAFKGRLIWHELWLTEKALPMTKRDVARLGITATAQLDRPLPQGIRVRVKLALRRDDDGTEHNKVLHFEVIGIDAPVPDPFAPTNGPTDSIGDATGVLDEPPARPVPQVVDDPAGGGT